MNESNAAKMDLPPGCEVGFPAPSAAGEAFTGVPVCCAGAAEEDGGVPAAGDVEEDEAEGGVGGCTTQTAAASSARKTKRRRRADDPDLFGPRERLTLRLLASAIAFFALLPFIFPFLNRVLRCNEFRPRLTRRAAGSSIRREAADSATSLPASPAATVAADDAAAEENHEAIPREGATVTLDAARFASPPRLTAETFRPFLDSRRRIFVAYETDRCGNCVHLRPIWREFASVAEALGANFAVATVDCSGVQGGLCRDHDVEAFPTMRWHNADSKAVVADWIEFRGRRTVENLFKFAEGRIAAEYGLVNGAAVTGDGGGGGKTKDYPKGRKDKDESDSDDDAPAHPLTSSTFRAFVDGSPFAFIDFDASWCKWCQRLRPTWKKFAAEVESRGLPVAVGSVDCVAERDLCLAQRIVAFPTIRWYVKGVPPAGARDYKLDRTVEALVRFVEGRIGDARADEVDEFNAQVAATSQKGGGGPSRGDIDRKSSDNEGADEKESHDSEGTAPFRGDDEDDDLGFLLSDWNNDEWGNNEDEGTHEEGSVPFLGDQEDEEEEASEEDAPRISNKERKDYPEVIDDKEEESNEDEEVHEENAEPSAGDDDGGETAHPLTKATFRAFVEGSELAFVDFHSASWCMWSQRLRPTWKKFSDGVEARGLPVAVGSVDCVAEEDLCREQGVRAYPTMRWYVAGRAEMPEYKSDRTVEALMEYAEGRIARDGSGEKAHDELLARGDEREEGEGQGVEADESSEGADKDAEGSPRDSKASSEPLLGGENDALEK